MKTNTVSGFAGISGYFETQKLLGDFNPMCVCEGSLLSNFFPESPERREKVRSIAGFGVAGYDPILKTCTETLRATVIPDTLRIAINRLSLRIVRETGGQAVCDRLEREMAGLVGQVTP